MLRAMSAQRATRLPGPPQTPEASACCANITAADACWTNEGLAGEQQGAMPGNCHWPRRIISIRLFTLASYVDWFKNMGTANPKPNKMTIFNYTRSCMGFAFHKEITTSFARCRPYHLTFERVSIAATKHHAPLNRVSRKQVITTWWAATNHGNELKQNASMQKCSVAANCDASLTHESWTRG